MGADHGHSPIYVEHRVDSVGIGVDHPGLDTQRKHRNLGDKSSIDAMAGHGGHHQYPLPDQHPVSRCPPQVPLGDMTGMATVELKLAKEVARAYQDSLFLLFFDLRKTYVTVDYARLIRTL